MKITVKELALISLFVALTAIGAFLKIPFSFIPNTLQIFFVALAGVLLGSMKGMLSQAAYLLIGLVGVPIFAMGGGPTYVLQPSFGFLLGFVLGAFVIGKIVENLKTITFWKLFGAIAAGLVAIYLLGLPYLYGIYNFYLGKSLSLWMTLYNGFVIFIGGDLVSALIAALLGVKLIPILKKSRLL